MRRLYGRDFLWYLRQRKYIKTILTFLCSNLETVYSKRGVELINCDDHSKMISKMGKKLEDYRPDVTHQSLMALLDSPLNLAGLL